MMGGHLDSRLLIGGERVVGEGERFCVRNPATEEILGELPGVSAGQTLHAIAAARATFDSGVWSTTEESVRIQYVRRFVDYLASQQARIMDLSVREAGCPVASQTMMAQVHLPLQHGQQIVDLYARLPSAEENPLPIAERASVRGVVQSVRRYLLVGVVAAISAYNYPFFTNLWKVVPALLTGNAVILRPSPLTPFAALIFAEAAEAAELPRGVFTVIAEGGSEAAVTLSSHRDVDMVAFTGSTSVGKQVMIQAAPSMKRLQLELGGKSAQIYLPDAAQQARGAAAAVCLAHAGQGCALGTRIFVPDAEKATLLEAMSESLRKVVVGDPADPMTTLGPVISAAQRDRCQRYVDMAVAAGGRIVCGGSRVDTRKGYFFQPTVLDLPDNKNPAAQEEIFGPVVAVIGYRDTEHAIEMANDSVYGLSGYVFGKDLSRAVSVASKLRTGTVNINGGMASAYVSSGGWHQSGVGRERGIEGLRIYQQIQCMNIQAGMA